MKKIVLLFIALLLGATSVSFAQMSKADQELEQLNYYAAYELYKKEYNKNKNPKALKGIVVCTQKINLYKEFELYSQKWTMDEPQKSEAFMYYGEALIVNGKYKEAKSAFSTAETLSKDAKETAKAKDMKRRCDTAYKYTIAPLNKVELKPVDALNTTYSEWGLVKYFKGFVFSSERPAPIANAPAGQVSNTTGRAYLKMFTVPFNEDEQKFGAPVPFSDFFNGQYHTAGPAFTEKQSTVYFTRTSQVKVGDDEDVPVSRLEIFYCESFKDVKPFKYNAIDKYSVGDPAINSDGTRLYFVSDMPGGYGGTDIYYSDKLPNGDWGPYKNIGPEINSKENERFPMLMNDDVMFFSSKDRIDGLGGLDIYRATRKDDKWGRLYHMDYPINSPQDDFGFAVAKIRKQPNQADMVIFEGYLSSDRFGGKGLDDIYRFKAILPQFQMDYVYKGRMLSSETGAPITDVAIAVTDKETNQTKQYKSDAEGRYQFALKPNAEFEVVMKKSNFFSSKQSISTDNTDGSSPERLNIEFEPIVVNKSIKLESIYWDFNDFNITEKSKVSLDVLSEMLLDNPGIKIEIASHTDTKGDDGANMRMSELRAKSVLDYLVAKGVDGSRIKAKGYGEKQPLIPCGDNCEPFEDEKNRRTEFKVTEYKENKN